MSDNFYFISEHWRFFTKLWWDAKQKVSQEEIFDNVLNQGSQTQIAPRTNEDLQSNPSDDYPRATYSLYF